MINTSATPSGPERIRESLIHDYGVKNATVEHTGGGVMVVEVQLGHGAYIYVDCDGTNYQAFAYHENFDGDEGIPVEIAPAFAIVAMAVARVYTLTASRRRTTVEDYTTHLVNDHGVARDDLVAQLGEISQEDLDASMEGGSTPYEKLLRVVHAWLHDAGYTSDMGAPAHEH